MFKADAIQSNIECTVPIVVTTSTGTYTLTVDSPSQIIFEGTAGDQIIKLPDATTLEDGWLFRFWNKSTKLITVVDNGDNTVASIISTDRIHIVLENNAVANGTWVTEPQVYRRLLNSASTGILVGGYLSVNGGDNTKFDISDGNGIIVNNYTDVNNPTITSVYWTGKTALTPTYLLTHISSYAAIDASGNVIQQTTAFTAEQTRDLIVLGKLVHPTKTILASTNPVVQTGFDAVMQLLDFCRVIGPLNIDGNEFYPNDANLSLNKSAGVVFRIGSNYDNSNKDPSTYHADALTVASWTYFYRSLTSWNAIADVTDIDPDYYDDGSGTLQAVTAGYWTIQTIFQFSGTNKTVIQYGQVQYSTLAAALSERTTNFAVNPVTAETCFRCWLFVKQGATDLSDPTQAQFVHAGKFGLINIVSSSIGGEVNTASNVGGTGVGFFKQKSGVELQFKNLKSVSARLDVDDNPGDNTVMLTLGGIKSGTVAGASFAGNPKKYTVTFVTPFADATYDINITGEDARIWSYESKAAGSFVINSNANQVLAGEVSWRCAIAENV